MGDPSFIEGPSLDSFSGGRSSGRMLYGRVQAHGGSLPDHAVVGYANTGKEREETLRFVHECGSRWGVDVTWVEWRPSVAEAARIAEVCDDPAVVSWAAENANDEGFAIVGPNSASRKGEPFAALLALKQRLPNGQERWCTQYLKVLPLHALMRHLGHGEPGAYLEPIGLRHGEGTRILSGLANAEKAGRRVTYPLDRAKIGKQQVADFWFGEGRRYETGLKPQGFDLELPSLWGNCDLCFGMGERKLEERVRRDPSVAPWWAEKESRAGGTFSKRYRVIDLVQRAKQHDATPDLIGFDDDDDAGCGEWCPGEEAA